MMFDKNNTNFGGECLCCTCKHGIPNIPQGRQFCFKDYSVVDNVGVCKDYEEVKND